MTPAKPPEGDPCNGCGVCCIATPCGVALQLLSDAEMGRPCPALEWEGGRSWCGLVRNPTLHIAGRTMRFMDWMIGRNVRKALGGDAGCDSRGHEGQIAADVYNRQALGLPLLYDEAS